MILGQKIRVMGGANRPIRAGEAQACRGLLRDGPLISARPRPVLWGCPGADRFGREHSLGAVRRRAEVDLVGRGLWSIAMAEQVLLDRCHARLAPRNLACEPRGQG